MENDSAELIGQAIPELAETEPRLNYDDPEVLINSLHHLRHRIDIATDQYSHYREYHLEVIDAVLELVVKRDHVSMEPAAPVKSEAK